MKELRKEFNQSQFTNTQADALINTISKILEKYFKRRIGEFFNEHKIIIPHQFGFQIILSKVMHFRRLQTTMSIQHKSIDVFLDLTPSS